MPTPDQLAPADFIEGAAKSLRLLEAFSPERQRLNATQAAERAQLSRAAARRHLLTLEHLGYLEGDGEGSYWLTPRVLRLSGIYLASARLPRLVQPTLNRLALQTGLTFSVAVFDGAHLQAAAQASVVIVARSTLPAFDRATATAYGLHLGARPAVHATSTGRVLLAQLNRPALNAWLAAQPKPLPRLTANTITQAAELRKAVAIAQTQDHAYAREENELGVHAIAIPLRNANGHCAGALNAVASTDKTSADSLRQQVLPLMRAEARDLALAL